MTVEKILIVKLDARYQKKAHELCTGGVPDDKYRAQVAYMQALRDVMQDLQDAQKEVRESK